MNTTSPIRRFVLTVSLIVLAAGGVAAQSGIGSSGKSVQSTNQIKVGKAELKRFASTLTDVHTIQVGFRKGLQKAVTSSSLGQKQFLRIYRFERSNHKLPAELSAQQKKQYNRLVKRVLSMEQDARKAMVAVVKKDGFTVARFDAIVNAVHTNPDLAKRLNKIRKK